MPAKKHFILSNRRIYSAFGKSFLHLETEIHPNLPLYYCPIEFDGVKNLKRPESAAQRTDNFVDTVLEECTEEDLAVILFIHGYHHLVNLSFKTDLFCQLAKRYNKNGRSVRFIFFSWPASRSRHFLDDRAEAQGRFLHNQAAALFRELKMKLNARGIQFNLLAHSMGHRILNGFSSQITDTGDKLFNQAFLTGADIPQRSLDVNLPGIVFRNRKNSLFDGKTPDDDKERYYNLLPVCKSSDCVWTYYHKYDRVLLAGLVHELKKSEQHSNQLVRNALPLGTIGLQGITHWENVREVDTSELLTPEFQFSKALSHRSAINEMEALYERLIVNEDFKYFLLFRKKREAWIKLHRYFIESENVIMDVNDKIKNFTWNSQQGAL